MRPSNAIRVAVFIDDSNLHFAVKDGLKTGNRVDIEKLSHKLVQDRQLVRIYFYTAPRPPEGDDLAARAHQRFLDRLGWISYLQLREGRLLPRQISVKCPSCGENIEHRSYIQKGVDTRIVVDMVSLAVREAYDVAILVSGDSDLAEAVNFVKEHTSKKIENACVPWRGWAKNLREAADVRIPLTQEFLADCWREERETK